MRSTLFALLLVGCGDIAYTEVTPRDAGAMVPYHCDDVRQLGTLDWCMPNVWLTLPETVPDLGHLDIIVDGVLLPRTAWHVCSAHYCHGRAVYVDVCSPVPDGLRQISYSYNCRR